MTTERAVLEATYEALNQEFNRIAQLLSTQNSPLGEEKARRIGGKFGKAEARARGLLLEIGEAMTRNALDEAWQKCVELKTQVMPPLASELLAVIGGLYLIDASLDNVRPANADSPLSFSRMAEELVTNLAERSGSGWGSVLIVGEERVGYTEAEIIRLRFPACDIWHLPFTAHEYGYLVAQIKAPELFRNMLSRVRQAVDPATHKDDRPPPDAPCFLPEVRRLWEHYHRELLPSERTDFSESHQQELTALAHRQETHLCRLFADSFATLFAGPAYVHALLHLRFVPDETLYQPAGSLPALADRFVFTLECLKWMNDDPYKLVTPSEPLFQREVDGTLGIPRLWAEAVKSAGQHNHYDQLARDYSPWLNELAQILQQEYGTKNSLGGTYDAWLGARKGRRARSSLVEKLVDPVMTVEQRPKPWVVLNAAWAARVDHPLTMLPAIQANALRLLDSNDSTVLAASERAAGSFITPARKEERLTKEKAIALVKETLAENQLLLLQFREMERDARGFIEDRALLKALAPYDEAFDAYRWLTGRGR